MLYPAACLLVAFDDSSFTAQQHAQSPRVLAVDLNLCVHFEFMSGYFYAGTV